MAQVEQDGRVIDGASGFPRRALASPPTRPGTPSTQHIAGLHSATPRKSPFLSLSSLPNSRVPVLGEESSSDDGSDTADSHQHEGEIDHRALRNAKLKQKFKLQVEQSKVDFHVLHSEDLLSTIRSKSSKQQQQWEAELSKPTENDDVPFWGPGILFYEEQKSRELKVMTVLEPPHGPGQKSGVKRGDTIVNVDALGEPRVERMDPHKILLAILGERNSKVRLELRRGDDTGGLALQYELTLERRNFDIDPTSLVSTHGVLSIVVISAKNINYEGASSCEVFLTQPESTQLPHHSPRAPPAEPEPAVNGLDTITSHGTVGTHGSRPKPSRGSTRFRRQSLNGAEAEVSHEVGEAVSALGALEPLMLSCGVLWTRPVPHSPAKHISPRWGTKFSYLVHDSRAATVTVRLHKTKAKGEAGGGRLAELSVPVTKVGDSTPKAELTMKVSQIAAGSTGGVWGQNNWFSLTATSPEHEVECGLGQVRVRFLWYPAQSSVEAADVLRGVLDREKANLVKKAYQQDIIRNLKVASTTMDPKGADHEQIAGMRRMWSSEDSVFAACRSHNRKLLAQMLKSTRDCLRRRDQAGHTPLHVVCMNECEKAPEMAQAILEADPKLAAARDLLLQTPLHLACRNKGPTASQDRGGRLHTDMEPCIHRLVLLLLDAAPETALMQDCDGLIPLDYACRNPHPKAVEAVRILVERCRDALKPEVLSVDIQKIWSRLSQFSSCSTFGGRTMLSDLSDLGKTLQDGVKEVGDIDSPEGYVVRHFRNDVSRCASEALMLAVFFDAFANAALRNSKTRRTQERGVGVQLKIAAGMKAGGQVSDVAGEQGVMGQLQKSVWTLSEVSAYWMSAAESLPVLLGKIMELPDNVPNLALHLQSEMVRAHKMVNYRVADPLTTFQRLPAHFCCASDSKHISDVLQMVLDHDPQGASVTNWDNQLALHFICATLNPHIETLVGLLLQRNSQACRVQDWRGMLPLHIACSNAGPASARIVRMLLAAHKDAAACLDGEGKYPIDRAIVCTSLAAGEMVTLLMDAFPTAALRLNKFGQTVLHQAVIASVLPLTQERTSVSDDVRAKLLELFFIFDKKASGRVDLDELSTALENMGFELTREEIEQLVVEVDIDRNGELDFVEFVEFVHENFLVVRRDDVLVSSGHMVDRHNHLSSQPAPHAPDLISAILDSSANLQKDDLPDYLQEVYVEGCSPLAAIDDDFGRCPLFYAAASRSITAEKIAPMLIEHFPEGLIMVDAQGDTPLHYASAVSNVTVAAHMVNSSTDKKRLAQHIRNQDGRFAIDLAVNLSLRLILSGQDNLIVQKIRNTILVTISVLHGLLNLVWAVFYIRSEAYFTVYYIAILYTAGLGCIFLVLRLRSRGVCFERDRTDHAVIVFKRYEAFIILMPLSLLHAFAAVNLEDRGQTVPWEYWAGVLFSLCAWTASTVILDGSLCHATSVGWPVYLLELVSVTVYRLAEKSSRIAMVSLVMLEYRMCYCRPPGYDSITDCYCYSNLVAPGMLLCEWLFLVFLLAGVRLPSHQVTNRNTRKAPSSSVYLRALLNLVGVHYGRMSGTTITSLMSRVGKSSALTSSFLGEVRVWDAVIMVVARAVNHFMLFLLLSSSAGIKEELEKMALRDLSVGSEDRAVLEAYVLIAGAGTVVQWAAFLLKYISWRYADSRANKLSDRAREATKGAIRTRTMSNLSFQSQELGELKTPGQRTGRQRRASMQGENLSMVRTTSDGTVASAPGQEEQGRASRYLAEDFTRNPERASSADPDEELSPKNPARPAKSDLRPKPLAKPGQRGHNLNGVAVRLDDVVDTLSLGTASLDDFGSDDSSEREGPRRARDRSPPRNRVTSQPPARKKTPQRMRQDGDADHESRERKPATKPRKSEVEQRNKGRRKRTEMSPGREGSPTRNLKQKQRLEADGKKSSEPKTSKPQVERAMSSASRTHDDSLIKDRRRSKATLDRPPPISPSTGRSQSRSRSQSRLVPEGSPPAPPREYSEELDKILRYTKPLPRTPPLESDGEASVVVDERDVSVMLQRCASDPYDAPLGVVRRESAGAVKRERKPQSSLGFSPREAPPRQDPVVQAQAASKRTQLSERRRALETALRDDEAPLAGRAAAPSPPPDDTDRSQAARGMSLAVERARSATPFQTPRSQTASPRKTGHMFPNLVLVGGGAQVEGLQAAARTPRRQRESSREEADGNQHRRGARRQMTLSPNGRERTPSEAGEDGSLHQRRRTRPRSVSRAGVAPPVTSTLREALSVDGLATTQGVTLESPGRPLRTPSLHGADRPPWQPLQGIKIDGLESGSRPALDSPDGARFLQQLSPPNTAGSVRQREEGVARHESGRRWRGDGRGAIPLIRQASAPTTVVIEGLQDQRFSLPHELRDDDRGESDVVMGEGQNLRLVDKADRKPRQPEERHDRMVQRHTVAGEAPKLDRPRRRRVVGHA